MLLNFLCERNNFLFLCFNAKTDSQVLFNPVIENCRLNVWNVLCGRPFPRDAWVYRRAADALVGLRAAFQRPRTPTLALPAPPRLDRLRWEPPQSGPVSGSGDAEEGLRSPEFTQNRGGLTGDQRCQGRGMKGGIQPGGVGRCGPGPRPALGASGWRERTPILRSGQGPP